MKDSIFRNFPLSGAKVLWPQLWPSQIVSVFPSEIRRIEDIATIPKRTSFVKWLHSGFGELEIVGRDHTKPGSRRSNAGWRQETNGRVCDVSKIGRQTKRYDSFQKKFKPLFKNYKFTGKLQSQKSIDVAHNASFMPITNAKLRSAQSSRSFRNCFGTMHSSNVVSVNQHIEVQPTTSDVDICHGKSSHYLVSYDVCMMILNRRSCNVNKINEMDTIDFILIEKLSKIRWQTLALCIYFLFIMQ